MLKLKVNILEIIKQKLEHLLVTVLFTAVNAVNTLTSHRNILLSKPPLATCSLSFAYAKHLTKSLMKKSIEIAMKKTIFLLYVFVMLTYMYLLGHSII
jgi:hypothetical protein